MNILDLERLLVDNISNSAELEYWPFLKDLVTKSNPKLKGDIRHRETARYRPSVIQKIIAHSLNSVYLLARLSISRRKHGGRVLVFSAASRLNMDYGEIGDEFVGKVARVEPEECLVPIYHKSKNAFCESDVKIPKFLYLNLVIVILENIIWWLGVRPKLPDNILNIVSQNTCLDLAYLANRLTRYRIRVIVYFRLLKLLNAEKVYVVSAYTKTDLVNAAKRLKLPVKEIQHGMIGQFHTGYRYLSLDSPWVKSLPDEILVDSEFWLENQRRCLYSQVVLLPTARSQNSKSSFYAVDKRFILITGQGIAIDEFYNLILDILNSPCFEKFDVYYLCHPNESANELSSRWKALMNSRLSILRFKNSSFTLNLIKNCAVHISIFSSCHVDALHFKKTTYVYDVDRFSDELSPFKDIDGVKFFTNCEELSYVTNCF